MAGQDRGDVPFRVRFELPLSLIPFAAGVATAVPLWGADAPDIFFSTSAEVIALGAVAMALQGRFFRMAGQRRSGALTRVAVLISVGIGLGFAFGALIRDDLWPSHVPMTAGALAMGISAFAVQAIFGGPLEDADEP